jgi:WD40 repeat protein
VDPTAKRETARNRTALVTVTDARLFTALATDCLRMSMHFFHPIQQCAQQVYHTALPLSPTSSVLRNSYIRNVTDNQLSRITTFSGAPDKWGLLLRTIDVRPRRLVCIATSAQRIIAACEDITNVYDAVTFALQQSLRIPEPVTKAQCSPDDYTLFFAHSHSVTMWDVQTGGLTHTFTTWSDITDIAVSTTGDHIACGSSNGSVTFWNTHTKEKGKGFGNRRPVVALLWLSSRKLAVATQGIGYDHDIDANYSKPLDTFHVFGDTWGLVRSPLGRGEYLVGVLESGKRIPWNSNFLKVTPSEEGPAQERQEPKHLFQWSLTRPGEKLSAPTVAGKVIACITPPRGVLSFDTQSRDSMGKPPPLDAATSVAVSLNRNLVAQTEDSIQIFSLDVLKVRGARNTARSSHVYSLGGKHIISLLQPDQRLTILDLRTLRELDPHDKITSLESLLASRSPSALASFSRGLVAEFGISMVTQAWRSGVPLPERAEAADEDPPLSGLSPDYTLIVTFYGSPRWELRVKDANDGTILAELPLGDGGSEVGTGEVYDVTFDWTTRFHLKIDGPGQHVQIPYDVIPSPSGSHSHTIAKGEPVPLSEPRVIPPYRLDANCEWVIDATSRKICWVSPGNVRRGNGGHFWVGLSLVMVGDDGVVRKLSFREPGS